MPKTFVTGGSGFIGGHLIDRLVADGHQVKGLARSDRAAQAILTRGAEAVRGDIHDVAAMRSAAQGCEWAFHAAAHVRDWGIPLDFERGNVDGTRNTLRACADAGVGRFVLVATEAAVLSGSPVFNLDETAPLQVNSPVLYGSSKARAEQFVLDANRDSFETTAIRPRFVWGPEDTTLLLPMVERVRANRYNWIGGGTHQTSTAHIDNVVEALILAASRPEAPGNAYFVTDGEPVVFREFVSELFRTQGVEPPTRNLPRPVAELIAAAGEKAWNALPLRGNPPLTRFSYWISANDCTLNDAKAREQLGYRPVTTREEGLAELRKAASTGPVC